MYSGNNTLIQFLDDTARNALSSIISKPLSTTAEIVASIPILLEELQTRLQELGYEPNKIPILPIDAISEMYENFVTRKALRDLHEKIGGMLLSQKILKVTDLQEALPPNTSVLFEEWDQDMEIDISDDEISGSNVILPGGMERKRVHVYKAPAGTGKSMFALNIGYRLALNGNKVLYISLENSIRETILRLANIMVGATKDDIRKNPFILNQVKTSIPDNLILVKSSPIMSFIFSAINKHVPDVLIVDYINKLATGRDTYTELGDIMQSFISISEKYNMSTILLAQANRAGEIAESYKIVMDADGVASLATSDEFFIIDYFKQRYFFPAYIVIPQYFLKLDFDNAKYYVDIVFKKIKSLRRNSLIYMLLSKLARAGIDGEESLEIVEEVLRVPDDDRWHYIRSLTL